MLSNYMNGKTIHAGCTLCQITKVYCTYRQNNYHSKQLLKHRRPKRFTDYPWVQYKCTQSHEFFFSVTFINIFTITSTRIKRLQKGRSNTLLSCFMNTLIQIIIYWIINPKFQSVIWYKQEYLDIKMKVNTYIYWSLDLMQQIQSLHVTKYYIK